MNVESVDVGEHRLKTTRGAIIAVLTLLRFTRVRAISVECDVFLIFVWSANVVFNLLKTMTCRNASFAVLLICLLVRIDAFTCSHQLAFTKQSTYGWREHSMGSVQRQSSKIGLLFASPEETTEIEVERPDPSILVAAKDDNSQKVAIAVSALVGAFSEEVFLELNLVSFVHRPSRASWLLAQLLLCCF